MSDQRDGQHHFEAPIRYQRIGRRTLILFPAALACALVCVLAASGKGWNPVMIALFATGLIVAYVIAASFVGPFCGSTTVNADGLTTRTLLRTRAITWSQVQSFGFSQEVDRGISHCLIEVRRHQGQAVVLPGLVGSSANDPEIRSRLVELRTAWLASQPNATTEESRRTQPSHPNSRSA